LQRGELSIRYESERFQLAGANLAVTLGLMRKKN
jgi:hypothetical protein